MIKKRTARARVFLDYDDFLILIYLMNNDFSSLDNLKKFMNMSHKGLLIHINRLKDYGFIEFIRFEDKPKYKKVFITPIGMIFLGAVYNSDSIKSYVEELKNNGLKIRKETMDLLNSMKVKNEKEN